MILSVHIPKTGGVSVRNILKQQYGPGFVLHYWEITDAWGRVLPEVPPTAECVHGHFQTDQLTGKFPDAKLITWVRDPVERVVSSYYHRLREPDWQHPVCQELHTRKLSLTEYAALPLVRNEMTRFFGSKQPEDFLFIGLMEQFELSLAAMTGVLGLQTAAIRQDNANPLKKAANYELEIAVRREIWRLNEQDVNLYARCREHWRNLLGRMGYLKALSCAGLIATQLARGDTDYLSLIA
jgi:hypothetical protein